MLSAALCCNTKERECKFEEEKKQTGLVTSSKETGKRREKANARTTRARQQCGLALDVSLVSPSPSMLCSPLSPQNLICKHDSTHSRYSPHVFLAMLRIFCSMSLFRPNSPFSLAALSFASTRRTTSSLLAWSLMAVCWLLCVSRQAERVPTPFCFHNPLLAVPASQERKRGGEGKSKGRGKGLVCHHHHPSFPFQ